MVDAALESYKSNMIVGLIPTDAPLKITMEDAQRALPKLQRQGKIWRDGRGTYHLGRQPDESKVNNFVLIKDDEGQSDRTPLAG
jgi:hypothetical protein